MSSLPPYLLAAMPATIHLSGELSIDRPPLEAAAGGEGGQRTFTNSVAYSGGAIKQWWSRWPLVVDLSAMDTTRQQIPLQYAHDSVTPDSLLGQTSAVENNGQNLRVSGAFYPDGPVRDHVVARADQGHQWQLSIGADPGGLQFVEPGTKISVNGREWTGPLNVVRPSTLREVSVVRLGADPYTSAVVANRGGFPMAEPATIQPDGGAPSTPPASVAAGSTTQATPPAASTPAPAAAPVQPGAPDATASVLAAVQAQLEANAKAMASMQETVNKMQNLQATREQRPSVPAGHIAASIPDGVNADMVRAASLCMNAGMSTASLEARFKEPGVGGEVLSASQIDAVLQAAHSTRRNVSLVQLIVEAARTNGLDVPGYRIDANNAGPILRAAFSTHNIGNVLGTAYGKFALESFMAPEDPWREMTQVRPVNDYKEITGVRAGGDFRLKPLTDAGKIRDAELSDETRSISADMFARMASLTIKDITNDDLGRLQSLGSDLGNGAITALLEDYWTTFEANNSTYFTAVTPAAGNALSLASLDTADTTFSDMVDSFGNKAVVEPTILLVPAALKNAAMELMRGTVLITGKDTTRTNLNVFAGRYRVIYSRYLTSKTTWWLIGRSGSKAPMEIALLNGQETPTIQSAEADFNTLGIQFRAFMPWGVKKAEKLTCVRMATA